MSLSYTPVASRTPSLREKYLFFLPQRGPRREEYLFFIPQRGPRREEYLFFLPQRGHRREEYLFFLPQRGHRLEGELAGRSAFRLSGYDSPSR